MYLNPEPLALHAPPPPTHPARRRAPLLPTEGKASPGPSAPFSPPPFPARKMSPLQKVLMAAADSPMLRSIRCVGPNQEGVILGPIQYSGAIAIAILGHIQYRCEVWSSPFPPLPVEPTPPLSPLSRTSLMFAEGKQKVGEHSPLMPSSSRSTAVADTPVRYRTRAPSGGNSTQLQIQLQQHQAYPSQFHDVTLEEACGGAGGSANTRDYSDLAYEQQDAYREVGF